MSALSFSPTQTAPDILALHAMLVDELTSQGYIRTASVEAAFRAIPRHVFVPHVSPWEAYGQRSIPTKRIHGRVVSSSSAPPIMASMLEQLDLQPGHRVLEIGAGTGYNAALMAQIVGASGEVVTVDLDEDIVAAAREHLDAAGYGRVRVVCGDGAQGVTEAATFDRIVLTIATPDISPAWREPLKPGGRLLLPLQLGGMLTQKLVAFQRAGCHLRSVSVRESTFLMLRGVAAGRQRQVRLGRGLRLQVAPEHQRRIDAGRVAAALGGPGRDRSTGVWATPREIRSGLLFHLGLREASLCRLTLDGANADAGMLPWLVPYPSSVRTYITAGLLDEGGMAFLTRPSDRRFDGDSASRHEPVEVCIRALGCGERVARSLDEQVRAWDAGGRRSGEGLRIRAYPTMDTDRPLVAGPGEIVVRKRSTTLVLDWS